MTLFFDVSLHQSCRLLSELKLYMIAGRVILSYPETAATRKRKMHLSTPVTASVTRESCTIGVITLQEFDYPMKFITYSSIF